MRKYLILLTGLVIFTVIFNNIPLSHAETDSFGDPESVAFAEQLWQAMQKRDLVGDSGRPDKPYKGTHPHGAILETLMETLSINDREGEILVKRNYGGAGVSINAVSLDRSKYLQDVTVMFKRDKGYDDENQDWFWAKYDANGKLAANPRGRQLAGRVARGKPKGCIACHKMAPGGDFLFVN
jgi:hypothetical protein